MTLTLLCATCSFFGFLRKPCEQRSPSPPTLIAWGTYHPNCCESSTSHLILPFLPVLRAERYVWYVSPKSDQAYPHREGLIQKSIKPLIIRVFRASSKKIKKFYSRAVKTNKHDGDQSAAGPAKKLPSDPQKKAK